MCPDLQTGNAEAGKQYFDRCRRMRNLPLSDPAISQASHRVTRASNGGADAVSPNMRKSQGHGKHWLAASDDYGIADYLDEFTVGLIDPTGSYRSWRTSDVQYKVDAPVTAHGNR